ncbi:endoplasmic reticulum membrane-associated RNA degradation protein isoform X2 [Mixophyes fleayi]|uniref:endoplasmic reticulum membrane-associated RNA degradation protein isoform X2 n=1 Tax=Mixophyes fleayi TaxID=3061075 RepID=UPI003F4DBC30
MSGSIPLTTCLSPTVYNMVCQLGFEVQGSVDILNILDRDNQVCWGTICGKVSHLSTDQGLNYAESVRQLGPLCDAVHTYLMSLPNEKYIEAFQDHFQWTNNCELFLNALAVLKSLDGTKISLHLMKMTACLEFSLGDVYLTIGKNCPFLLRDLLASEELEKIFNKPVMDLLRVFLGSPESLNLRNILWHGFASPQEIPPKYCSMLVLLTVGLGQLLQTRLSNTGSTVVHRLHFVFRNLHEMQTFPDVDEEVLSLAEKLIQKSQFVLPHMAAFWIEAITAFRQGRYADCAILLLSQLETSLRLIFTSVNECPDRMLTAESTNLYTTFDEILSKHLNNASDNKVPDTLGEPAMEFIWDFLNHQEGPRVRDHLSHGEIQLSDFPKQIANELLGFSVVLLYKLLEKDSFDKEIKVLYPLIDTAGSYHSRFHPIALLQKQVLQCSESLQKWQLLPFPSLDHETKGLGDKGNPGKSFSSEMAQILSLLQLHKKICISTKDLDSWLQTDRWFVSMKEMCNKRISNLYCHRWVLETVSILRKVSTQCLLVSCNILSTSKLRYEQWLNKTLRSRQRQNYLRLMS